MNERALTVVVDDLLAQKVELIVCDWHCNRFPLALIPGHAREIREQAGREPFRELREQGTLPLGGAALTGPGRLPLKGIVFVAVRHLLTGRSSERAIQASVENALRVARSLGFRSVAFPVLGAGGGVSERRAYEVLRNTLLASKTDIEVRIVRSPDRPA